MASTAPLPYMTEEEYLAFERNSDTKHEYLDGQIYAMAGGSFYHDLICVNISSGLQQRLEGKSCTTHSSNLQVRVSAVGLYTYPDAFVICGEPQFIDDRDDIVENPIVIVEVLSPSTARYDQGGKFALYRQIPTLQTYITVSQKKAHVTIHTRQGDGWYVKDYIGLENNWPIDSLDCVLPFSAIYSRVKFK